MSLFTELIGTYPPGYQTPQLSQTETPLTPNTEGSDSVEPSEGKSPITEKTE